MKIKRKTKTKKALTRNEYMLLKTFSNRDKSLYNYAYKHSTKRGKSITPSEWLENKNSYEMSFREIAKEMNTTVTNVIHIYHTAMFKIKLYLESKELLSLYDFYTDQDKTLYDS